MNLNAKTTGALQLPAGKSDIIVWDDTMIGFGYRLRAGAGGTVLRSWVVQYRRAGASRRMTLGPANVLSADQARSKAKKALAQVALGSDPQAELIDRRAKDAHVVRSVVAEYLAAKEPKLRPRTYKCLLTPRLLLLSPDEP
jgi:hypothetical protein